MRQTFLLAISVTALSALLQPVSSESNVIAEDQGLYKKETWNIQKYYDDLNDPNDARGIITKGKDPADPSGPAVDFRKRPGALGLEYENEKGK